MGVLSEILSLLHPHYVTNLFVSLMFYVLKVTPPICSMIFNDCHLELREWELLTFLGCIIVLKNRKQPSYKTYISTAFMFSKVLSTWLFFRQSPIMGISYVLLCFLHMAFFPEPAYKGPDCVTYFRGPHLEDEIKRDPRVTWLICFYAAWSPQCVSFSSIFAELSAKYNLENLKFGKVDVTRFPDLSQRFRVDPSSWSRQLPTVILFKNGREYSREPEIDHVGKPVGKFIFSRENVLKSFTLNELFQQCKNNPLKKRKKNKKDLEHEGEDEVAGNGDKEKSE